MIPSAARIKCSAHDCFHCCFTVASLLCGGNRRMYTKTGRMTKFFGKQGGGWLAVAAWQMSWWQICKPGASRK